jgi:hypothetical protein
MIGVPKVHVRAREIIESLTRFVKRNPHAAQQNKSLRPNGIFRANDVTIL